MDREKLRLTNEEIYKPESKTSGGFLDIEKVCDAQVDKVLSALSLISEGAPSEPLDEAKVKEILKSKVEWIGTDYSGQIGKNYYGIKKDSIPDLAKAICACHGKEQSCPECKGSGKIMTDPRWGTPCPTCHGTGKVEGEVRGQELDRLIRIYDARIRDIYIKEKTTEGYMAAEEGTRNKLIQDILSLLAAKGGRE